ncbi:MAG TPA: hypothetical protein VGG48_18630 [Rhizomicrobium sp.]|jgi:hypothetical protein
MMKFVVAASAVLLWSSAGFADDTSMPAQAAAPAAASATSAQVVCHHDGEVIQSATGPVLCHMKKPQAGVHNMSREWFRDQQLRSAQMNH